MPERRAVLLVEGRDDREVVYQICNHHRIDNRTMFDVKDTDGYENLRDSLLVMPKTGVPVIGAILDADLDAEARWQSVCDALRSAGYDQLPAKPTPGGTLVSTVGLPPIGVWMMPDNHAHGSLEDFMALLIQEHDQLLPRAVATVDELPDELVRFPPERRSKAVMHTWLAWQEEPGTALGLAFTRRYVRPDHPRVAELVAWLMRVFRT